MTAPTAYLVDRFGQPVHQGLTVDPATNQVVFTVQDVNGATFTITPAPLSPAQVGAGVASSIGAAADGTPINAGGGSGYVPTYDRGLARSSRGVVNDIVYRMLPQFADFGLQRKGVVPSDYTAVFFDSTAPNGGDGSFVKPYNSIYGFNFSTPKTIVFLKYGSVFLAVGERFAMCAVTAENVEFVAYGDASQRLPLITGAIAIPAASFQLNGSEYRAPLARTLSTQCMAVCYQDSPNIVLPNGTPGSLTSGQAGADNSYVYLKDQPAAGRVVLVSVTQLAVAIQASHFRTEAVAVGYCTNSGFQLAPSSGVQAVYKDAILRDTKSFYCGNNGIQIGSGSDLTQGYTDVILLRHTDEGSGNNGINSNGDDSRQWWVQPVCNGRLRGVGNFTGAGPVSYTGAWGNGGYYNDAVTAHGVGAGPIYVLDPTCSNAQENGVDIVGGPANLDAHQGSRVMFGRISYMGQPGMLLWAGGIRAEGVKVSDCQQDGARFGDSTHSDYATGGYLLYCSFQRCGLASGSAGVGLSWQNVVVHGNTFEVSAASLRSAVGNLDLTGSGGLSAALSSASIKANLFLHENTGDLIQANSSNATLIAKLGWSDNVYVTNVSTAFHYGGTTTSFSTWQTTNERSAQNYTTETAAGVTGTWHDPSFGTPLTVGGRAMPGYDIDGAWRTTGIGASQAKS